MKTIRSYFYSSKTSNRKTYPISDGLDSGEVVQILHDHSVLAQIFWPHSSATVRAEMNSPPSMSEFVIGQQGSSYKATLCSQENGATCIEELHLGIKVTIVYSVATQDQLSQKEGSSSNKDEAASTSGFSDFTVCPPDHQLYLVEEKTMTVLKPASFLLGWNEEGIILKTKNLLQVLTNLGETRMGIMSALADLNGMATIRGTRNLTQAKIE
ncbi:hypothetical protein M3J09_006093 [Ascochyta lentis]